MGVLALGTLPAWAEPPGWSFCIGDPPTEAAIERCVATVEGLCKAATNHDLCVVESAQLWMQYDANATLNHALRNQTSEDVGMTALSQAIAGARPDFSQCAPQEGRCYLKTVVGQALSNLEARSEDP